MADVEVKAFSREDRKLFEVFLRFPRKLHHGERYWVPEFLAERRRMHDPRSNPELRTLNTQYFLAYRANEPLGRMVAFLERDSQEADAEGKRVGWFGFFECEDDPGGALALFDAGSRFLAERGCTHMRGPSGFTSMTTWGMLAGGRFEDAPAVLMPWNPRHYMRLCERAKMRPATEVFAYELTNWHWPNEDLQAHAKQARDEHGIRLRPIRLERSEGFAADVEIARELFHVAWANSWGFAPIDATRFAHLAHTMRGILHPELCLVAEHNGEPIGFAVCLPDINQLLIHTNGKVLDLMWHMWIRKSHLKLGHICTRARIAMVGVSPEAHGKGVEALFLERIMESCLRHGVLTVELSWVSDSTAQSHPLLQSLNEPPYKRYRIWERDLAAFASTSTS